MKNRFKELRARYDLTQSDLSKLVGVRRETIVFLEKGKYNPSLKLAYDISRVFKSNIEDVFIFEVQDDFLRKIVGALSLNLSDSEKTAIASGQTSNLDAREIYQQGWDHYLNCTATDNAKAADFFKRLWYFFINQIRQ